MKESTVQYLIPYFMIETHQDEQKFRHYKHITPDTFDCLPLLIEDITIKVKQSLEEAFLNHRIPPSSLLVALNIWTTKQNLSRLVVFLTRAYPVPSVWTVL